MIEPKLAKDYDTISQIAFDISVSELTTIIYNFIRGNFQLKQLGRIRIEKLPITITLIRLTGTVGYVQIYFTERQSMTELWLDFSNKSARTNVKFVVKQALYDYWVNLLARNKNG